MNILDENILEGQRELLRDRRVAVRHIGFDMGRKGMKDEEVIVLLHELDRPTLFTRDVDYYRQRLRHPGYCLVYLDVKEKFVADFARRFLRHNYFDTRAKRMGTIVRLAPSGITVWRLHAKQEMQVAW